MLDAIKNLVSINGVSGSEHQITEYIKAQVMPLADKVYTDVMGNLVAVKRGSGKRIMLMAHTDEIGLVATYADEKGFLRVAAVGGVSTVKMLNSYVTFENGVRGVLRADEVSDEIKIDNCFVDIGAVCRDDALSKIDIGMTARFDGDTFMMGDDLIVSKALDDRLGCYMLIEVLKQLKATDNEVYFVFTTQEEVGLRGAKVCGFDINPDVAIAVDIVTATDTPNCKRYGTSLGDGIAIKLRDASAICSKKVVDTLIETAIENDIKYQREAKTAGGTDIGAVQTAGRGALVGGVVVPIRNTHTITETASVRDVECGIKLLLAFVQKDIENIL